MRLTPRRTILALAAAGLALVPAAALAGLPHTSHAIPVEARSLTQLYQAALKSHKPIMLYAGGDEPGQFNQTIAAFDRQFPGLKLKVDIDLSKYQDARVDLQLASHQLQPDVVMLQTTQDFDRWKQEGVLLPYKPLGWNAVEPRYKDPAGDWVGTSLVAFTDIVNTNLVPAADQPINYLDFLKPQYKNKISLTYPNDDDAVLFDWKLIVDKYGWGYVRRLLAQHPAFVRGTPASVAPLIAGHKEINFASFFPFSGVPGYPVKIELPTKDPFVSWAQRAAIFRQSPNPAGGELLESWLLSKPVQESLPEWSVRSDVPAPAAIGPIANYNTNPSAFPKFMSNRAAVDRFRQELTLYIGEPTGPDPAGAKLNGPLFTP